MNMNTSVSELLANFQNRRSKQVAPSRMELIRQYVYLNDDDQQAIRLAFLRSPSIYDNLQGCKFAIKRWSGEELSDVETVWAKSFRTNNDKAWYYSSRLLIRHSSTDYLLSNMERLTHFLEGGSLVKSLYYHLALRLHKEPSFVLDKSKLYIGDYYRLKYQISGTLSEDEWVEDFIRAVTEMFVFSATYIRPNTLDYIRPIDSVIARVCTKEMEHIPNPMSSRWSSKDRFLLLEEPSLHDILLYGSLMGCTHLNAAMQFLHDAEYELMEEAKDSNIEQADYLWWSDRLPKDGWNYEKSPMSIPCVEILKSCCPEIYQSCLAERIMEYEDLFESYFNKPDPKVDDAPEPEPKRKEDNFRYISPDQTNIPNDPNLHKMIDTLDLLPIEVKPTDRDC